MVQFVRHGLDWTCLNDQKCYINSNAVSKGDVYGLNRRDGKVQAAA